MINLDVVFIDGVCPSQYDSAMGDVPLGGTESTVIRIAEALGKLGLNVAVIQQYEFEPILGQDCLYLPWSYLEKINPKFAVHLRSVRVMGKFPKAKNFVWLHDFGAAHIKDWEPIVNGNNATVLTVSQWHQNNIKKYAEFNRHEIMYNPIASNFFRPREERPGYDPYQMVWMSSPHKGLDKAIETFSKLHAKSPQSKLLVFNPGYFKDSKTKSPGVIPVGAVPKAVLQQALGKSLCMFFPTYYEECGALVLSESNGLGVPVAGYPAGCNAELLSHTPVKQLFESEDELIDTVLRWQSGERPVVDGNENFRIKNVIKNWLRILQ